MLTWHRSTDPETEYRLEAFNPSELSPEDLSAWQTLANHAAEPNPFQEPAFLLPALRHLPQEDERVRLLVLRHVESGRWACAGAFCSLLPSVKRPLPRWRVYHTKYSFLDLPLVDRRDGETGAKHFFHQMVERSDGHGVRFVMLDRNSLMTRAQLDAGAREGRIAWYDRLWSRAALDLQQSPASSLLPECSKSRRKSLQRAYRRLSDQGRVEFRLRRPAPDEWAPLQNFLRLEDAGWKGEAGSSMRSRDSDAAFLQSVVRRLSVDGRAVFGELSVGGQVIASTCNFLAGNALFAFKIGWDPAFHAGSPGTWSELLLAEHAQAEIPELQWIDSCSSPESYLETIWPQRREMAGMSLTWSWYGVALVTAREQFRMCRNMLTEPDYDLSDPLPASAHDLCT